MSGFAIFQGVVIALVVLYSAVSAFRRFVPKTATRWQAALAAWCNQPSHGTALRGLARRLQPKAATGHCGDGCGSCGSCGPKAPVGDVQPLHFRPRSKT
jgi:hypothetical protein